MRTHAVPDVADGPAGHGTADGGVSALCTDLSEIRRAASYRRRDMHGPATFSLFARKLPANRGFLVSAGLADCLRVLEGFGFDRADLDYLRRSVGLSPAELDALAGVRFT